jgi:hypothetical protein
MQLTHDPVSVITSGVESASKFTIESNIGAFKILSDKLYSNKIGAVIRELSTNASDIHKLSNKEDVPFDVYLPTTIEPNFVIRDYGPGLSHEDCMSLYTTYFKSTKTSENVSTGCFGLGSKSPFAYTDSFMIQSVYNGVENNYVAVMAETGPCLNHLGSVESSEPSGMKISVPIASEDFSLFKTNCCEIYKFFDVTPNIYPKIDIHKLTQESTFYKKILDNCYINKTSSKNIIIMGQVAYEIKLQNIIKHKDSHYSDFFNKLNGLCIFAEVGDVDITPSRESLDYNNKTVSYLIKKVDDIIKHYCDLAEKEISSCRSLYHAEETYRLSDNPLKKKIKFKGEELFSRKLTVECIDYDRITNVSVDSYKINQIYIKDINNKCISKRLLRNLYRSNIKFLYNGTQEDLKKFFDIHEDDKVDIKKLSNISIIEQKAPTLSSSKYDHETKRFVETKVSIKNKDSYYIIECRKEYFINDRKINLYNLRTIIEEIVKKYGEINIYTFKPSKKENLEKRKDWKSLDSLVEEYVKEFRDKNVELINLIRTEVYFRDIDIAKQIAESSNDKSINSVIEEYQKISKEQSLIEQDKEDMVTEFKKIALYSKNFYEDFSRKVIDFNEKFNKIVEGKYPLISLFSYKDSRLANYIKQMDELKDLRNRFKNEVCN